MENRTDVTAQSSAFTMKWGCDLMEQSYSGKVLNPPGKRKIRKRGIKAIIFSVVALALILIVGRYGWTEVIIAYLGRVDSLSLPFLLGFGFLAGALSFFAPCAFVLFPGYVSYYLSQTEKREGVKKARLYPFRRGSRAGRPEQYDLVLGPLLR